MARVVIIGYGNILRGDDGIGPRAAGLLAAMTDPSRVTTISTHQLVPEHAHAIRDAKVVLFVDASHEAPGKLQCRRTEPALSGNPLTHQLTPGTLLGLTQQVFGKTPAAFEISIGGECFEFGSALSPAVEAELPTLVETVRQMAATQSA